MSEATKLYHGISIVVKGNIIGRIRAWTPSVYRRPPDALKPYEIGRPLSFTAIREATNEVTELADALKP